ncbi:hypothetical protein V8G54_021044 [Vigna mungo]|uniref:Yippee domain-containing protein n=1 Tax=Vigna mungo TaxID=3915 RepID=A0AAQ3RWI0_VIGMU
MSLLCRLMGRLFVVNLEGKIYSCKHCHTHLALYDDIYSKVPSLSVPLFSLLYIFSEYDIFNPLLLHSSLENSNGWSCFFFIRTHYLTIIFSFVIFRHSTADMGKLISSTRCKLSLLCASYHCVNVSIGEMEDRQMITGLHTVADIFCVGCGSIVGWQYETAYEKNQKYKEGKSVLERYKVSGPDGSNYWISHEAHVGGSDADDA